MMFFMGNGRACGLVSGLGHALPVKRAIDLPLVVPPFTSDLTLDRPGDCQRSFMVAVLFVRRRAFPFLSVHSV